MPDRYVYDMVDSRQRKGILQASIIQVRIVEAHAPLAILLRDNDDVGQPFKVLNLPDETGGQKLVNFTIYDFSMFWMESS